MVCLPFFAPPAYCWAMRSEPRKPEPKAEVTPEVNASARARARAHARSLGYRARSLDCRPLRIRIALALPASAGMISRKAAVLVLAIGADDPAVIETARAYETAMKERGGTVEAKHFSTGRRLRFAR